jgi:ParB family chromosome partitioning protein
MNHEHQDSGDTEKYTPVEIVEAARVAMGGIDLDPASCATANEVVRAGRYYAREDDGLQQPWGGRVFLNHPFARGQNHLWIDKLVRQYLFGDIESACCITWANMPDGWMIPLLQFPQCFPHKRVNYRLPDGAIQRGAPKGSVITYLGLDPLRFADAFRHIGTVKVAL